MRRGRLPITILGRGTSPLHAKFAWVNVRLPTTDFAWRGDVPYPRKRFCVVEGTSPYHATILLVEGTSPYHPNDFACPLPTTVVGKRPLAPSKLIVVNVPSPAEQKLLLINLPSPRTQTVVGKRPLPTQTVVGKRPLPTQTVVA